MILAGDIGGTHTRLAIFNNGARLVEKKFPSQEYHSLETIVKEFLKEQTEQISKACFGVAGPVREGRCQATNVPWIISAKKISTIFQVNSP